MTDIVIINIQYFINIWFILVTDRSPKITKGSTGQV
jgi:hypothetical protein